MDTSLQTTQTTHLVPNFTDDGKSISIPSQFSSTEHPVRWYIFDTDDALIASGTCIEDESIPLSILFYFHNVYGAKSITCLDRKSGNFLYGLP